ncbi:MAG: hypothetical protein DSZ18_03090 [Candidatus Thioglobus sp.]|nr:MAG: hypothetical protein DSZ18_03090 [Candidatus Thioglobus sp.]
MKKLSEITSVFAPHVAESFLKSWIARDGAAPTPARSSLDSTAEKLVDADPEEGIVLLLFTGKCSQPVKKTIESGNKLKNILFTIYMVL